MSIDAPSAPRRWRPWLWRGLSIAAVSLALCLGGAIALSKPFQEGSTRVFGRMASSIKNHPRATLAICLGGVAALWLGIGSVAAVQELRGRRGATPAERSPPSA